MQSEVSFKEALAFWLKLGFISFGGPAGQIAIMHSELVERRRWISERRFMHALNYCMVLPGPEAQQLATYIGWLLHGIRGGIAAGGLFILPSLVILILLSATYVTFGQVPAVASVIDGVKPAVVAIVFAAVMRIGARAIKNRLLVCFAVAAFLVLAWLQLPFPIIVVAAGLAGWLGTLIAPEKFKAAGLHGATKNKRIEHAQHDFIIGDSHEPPPHASLGRMRLVFQLLIGAILWLGPMTALVFWQSWDGTFTRMGMFFTSAALVTFGGAYAVLPYVAQQAVSGYQWLKPGQMLDGLALGETTPGPLIMVVTFVGFVGGFQVGGMGYAGAILGSLVATYFTFLPSFLFIIVGAPYIENMRGELRLTGALSGISAAVVGAIVNLALMLAKTAFFPDVPSDRSLFGMSVFELWSSLDLFALVVGIVSFSAMSQWKLSIPTIVLTCGLVGWLRYFLAA